MNLKGQIAIVTAAGQGMGRGIAEKLALEGAFVVVTGRTAEKVQETARIIESKGGKAFAVKADNSKVADIKHMFDECKAHFGAPDILVANVGVMNPMTPLTQITEEDYYQVYEPNAKGTMFCLKEAGLQLKDGGRIVAITSASARNPQKRMGVYSSSKAAIMNMVEVAAQEFADRNIRVNSVLAGLTETPTMLAYLPQPFLKVIAEQTPLKRIGTAEDIAGVVAFLCSADSKWVTGQHIMANGGSICF